MPTRITFRDHRTACEALQELISVQRNGAKGKKLDPDGFVATFAGFCLNEDGDQFSRINGALMELRCKLRQAVSRAASVNSPGRPEWAKRLTAVLHLSERVLGILPKGLSRLDPRTAVHRRRGINCGTYSTPDFVADEMCCDLLDEFPLGGRSRLDIADLSLEAGHFALSLLTACDSRTIRFYGTDRDPAALNLARKLVGFAQTFQRSRKFKLLTAEVDSISSKLPRNWPKTFDAIMGNPPWKTRHETDTHVYRNLFKPSLNGQFDVYLAFMLRAHALLKPGGLISMVIPSGFLFNQNAANIRQLLVNDYDILRLRIYPRRTFTEVPCIIPVSFLARKRETLRASRRRVYTTISYDDGSLGGPNRPRLRRSLNAAAVWRKLPGNVFHPLASNELLFLAQPLICESLQSYGKLTGGAQFGRQTRIGSAKSFMGVNGKDLRPFHCCTRNSVYFEAGVPLFGRTPPLYCLDLHKVIFQKTRCMTLPVRLVAACAKPGIMATSAALMFIPTDPRHAHFFEGLLNSQFANAWFKLREVNRSISLSVLANLPVRCAEKKWGDAAEFSRKLAEMRDCIHEKANCCTVTREDRVLGDRFPKVWAQILELSSELNRVIFNIYGFSRAERIAIEQFSKARVF